MIIGRASGRYRVDVSAQITGHTTRALLTGRFRRASGGHLRTAVTSTLVNAQKRAAVLAHTTRRQRARRGRAQTRRVRATHTYAHI